MPNQLVIDGRLIPSRHPATGLDMELNAEYEGITYHLSRVNRAAESSPTLILRFERHGKVIPDRLYAIHLMTSGNSHYKALGIITDDAGDGFPAYYKFGGDLEIKVEQSADQAIRTLPEKVR